MRTIVNMAVGKAEAEADLFFAHVDDAWERSARVIAMTHSLIVTVANMFGAKLAHEKPDYFNDSLRAPGESADLAESDDYPWADPEPAKAVTNGQQIEH
jgi:hypothetical protein